MSLAFNPWGLPNLLMGLVLLALAALVYRAGPARLQNRIVALFLLVLGSVEGLAVGLRFMAVDAATAYGFWYIRALGLALFPPLLLALYGTLPSRWTRGLGTRGARWGLAALAVGVGSLIFAFPQSVAPALVYVDPLDVWLGDATGPGTRALAVYLGGVVLAGLPIGWSSLRTARTGLERDKLRWLLVGVVGWGLLVMVTNAVPLALPGLVPGAFLTAALAFYGSAAASLVLGASIGYGILKAQLLDVELKVKRGIHHSTLAAVFIAVFFIVSEGAQVVLGDIAGNELLGIVAAGALVFALAPLQRLAGRISEATLPDVEDTPAYRERRGREIYAAAVESALIDGVITDAERDVLATLADQLDLSAGEARALERDVAGATGGGA